MTELTDQAAIDALLARFSNFYDALLAEVHLELPRDSTGRRATLRLLAADVQGEWGSVEFAVERLQEYKFTEVRGTNLVLSDGLAIHLLDGRTFVDLAPHSDAPAGIDDLRRSEQYVVGGTCRYAVGPYGE